MTHEEHCALLDRVYAGLPWTTRLQHWIACRIIGARERLRDTVLRLLGRTLYVRCASYCRVWRPCHRPATRSTELGGFPILCAACDDADVEPTCHEVGRWYRAPYWVSDEAAFRIVRPALPGTKALEP